jgi:hypothetical protein
MRTIKVFLFAATAVGTFWFFSSQDNSIISNLKNLSGAVTKSFVTTSQTDTTEISNEIVPQSSDKESLTLQDTSFTQTKPKDLPKPGVSLLADLLDTVPRRDRSLSTNIGGTVRQTQPSLSGVVTTTRSSQAEAVSPTPRELTLADISPSVAAEQRATTVRTHKNWARAIELLERKR